MSSYIAEYYKMGLYNKQDLDIFVKAGMITEEEKQTIIGTV